MSGSDGTVTTIITSRMSMCGQLTKWSTQRQLKLWTTGWYSTLALQSYLVPSGDSFSSWRPINFIFTIHRLASVWLNFLFCNRSVLPTKVFIFLIAVHVILIIAILLYALNTNTCSIYKNSFSFFCLFLMPKTIFCHPISTSTAMTAMPFSIVRY